VLLLFLQKDQRETRINVMSYRFNGVMDEINVPLACSLLTFSIVYNIYITAAIAYLSLYFLSRYLSHYRPTSTLYILSFLAPAAKQNRSAGSLSLYLNV
jgi:hypothetical protein